MKWGLRGALVLLVLCAAWPFIRRPPQTTPIPERVGWTSSATPSVAFALNSANRLEYSLPGGTGRIKLLINATLPPDVLSAGGLEPPGKPRPFQVEVELLDRSGTVRMKQTWDFLAEVQVYRDPSSAQLRSRMFYLDRNGVPSTTCEIGLELPQIQRLRTLRLKLVQADPAIQDFIVRAYCPETGSRNLQAHGWDRLADSIRAQLLSGNVYPEGLLREQEKRNLLSTIWKPLAPNSSWGPRPEQRQVYQVLENLLPEPGAAYEPSGLKLDSSRQAILHLPMAGGRFKLRIAASEAMTNRGKPSVLRLRWVGPGPGNLQFRTHAWTGETLEVESPFPGGYLIAESDRAGHLRAWQIHPSGAQEITPEAEHLGCVRLEVGEEVHFAVHPEGPLPFRIDLRQILPQPDLRTVPMWIYRDQITARWPTLDPHRSPASYRIHDATGKVIAQGKLPLDPWLSPLEDLPAAFSPARVSLPAATTLLLPATARRVSVRHEPSERPTPSILVSAFNRPADLPRLRTLPDDFYRFDTRETWVPTWFTLAPENLDGWLRSKRWTLLRTQSLPDAGDDGLLSGAYEIDPLPLETALTAQEILTPRPPQALPARGEGLPSYYREIRPGKEQLLALRGLPEQKALRPSLLRIGPSPTAPVSVEWNGRLLPVFFPGAPIQERFLPPVPPGTRTLKIPDHGTGRYFVNHLWPEPGDWLRRQAYRCGTSRTLVFLHERKGRIEESLNLGAFVPTDAASPVVIRLRLIGPGPASGLPLPSLTSTDRRFRLLPQTNDKAILLDGASTTLLSMPTAALPLGSDLPPGRYRVECTLESGPASYLTLSRSQKGWRPKTLMTQEPLIGRTP